MLENLKKILWLVDSKVFRQALRNHLVRLRDERNLGSLKAKREFQIIVNYSRTPTTLLDELCDRHGTDKGGSRGHEHPYPWLPHSYTDFLSFLFEPWRDQVHLVFENGIGTNDLSLDSNMGPTGVPGASLRVWRDYFPKAQIVGSDIDEKSLFTENRISTFKVDQTSAESVKDMWNKVGQSGFQLMIDDGLHEFQAGRNLFVESVHHLASNGTYIIEDVKHDDMLHYMDFFEDLDFLVNFVSLRRPPQRGLHVPLSDNQLVVVRRRQGN